MSDLLGQLCPPAWGWERSPCFVQVVVIVASWEGPGTDFLLQSCLGSSPWRLVFVARVAEPIPICLLGEISPLGRRRSPPLLTFLILIHAGDSHRVPTSDKAVRSGSTLVLCTVDSVFARGVGTPTSLLLLHYTADTQFRCERAAAILMAQSLWGVHRVCCPPLAQGSPADIVTSVDGTSVFD